MPQTRDAIDTIKGYYYQFDYFILRLLEEKNQNASICIEGIEDIDIENIDEKTAVQCKYYAKTEYQHSILKPAIILMLQHYCKNKHTQLKYCIYGHYKSGQEKLPNKISVEFLKKIFLTYTTKGNKHEVFKELGVEDKDLEDFLLSLNININAISYEEQMNRIITKFKEIYRCNDDLAYYYYSNALLIVRELSVKNDINGRKITPNKFLKTVKEKRECVFNSLFIYKRGIEEYSKFIRKTYFSSFNISPYERIFLIECDRLINDIEIKDIIYEISKKWGNISKRNDKPYCPYIFLYNISSDRLKNIKKMFQNDKHTFVDGYDFKDADFNINSILRQANYINGIEFKIINSIEELKEIIRISDKSKEIYQFYLKDTFYTNEKDKHIKIIIDKTENIKNMI